MTVYAETETIAGGCGVGVYCDFSDNNRWGGGVDVSKAPHSGGAGYLIVHYIKGDKQCNTVYKTLKNRFPIVFESEVRHNKNSDNKVYFCVYDTKDKCDYGFIAVDDYRDEDEDDEEGF